LSFYCSALPGLSSGSALPDVPERRRFLLSLFLLLLPGAEFPQYTSWPPSSASGRLPQSFQTFRSGVWTGSEGRRHNLTARTAPYTVLPFPPEVPAGHSGSGLSTDR